jgi:uncharacterized membrane protein
MTILKVVRIVAVLSSGLMAGILLGDLLGTASAREEMSASALVELQQIIHSQYVRVLPFLVLAAIGSAGLWLVFVRARSTSAELRLVAVALGAAIAAFVITIVVNMPINEQLMTWSATAPPADVREIWVRWERAHAVTDLLWLTAFSLEVIALGLSSSGIPTIVTGRDRTTDTTPYVSS